MKFYFDAMDNRPAYLQIVDRLVREIESGVHPRGQRLPDLSTLVAFYGTAEDIVLRALAQLRREGYVLLDATGDATVCEVLPRIKLD